MRPIVFCLVLLITYATDATAQGDPAKGKQNIDLLRDCQGRGDWYSLAAENKMDAEFFGMYDLAECVSYISGISDMNAVFSGLTGASLFCFPKEGLSQEQQVRVFIKWAEANPELLHESRRSGVVSAFMEAFPCE
jgi:hypothetical protein